MDTVKHRIERGELNAALNLLSARYEEGRKMYRLGIAPAKAQPTAMKAGFLFEARAAYAARKEVSH